MVLKPPGGKRQPQEAGCAVSGIVVLDEVTAGQIAAGEVVERPASAVKELVENALDAGASTIKIDLTEGGLASIAVCDDGCGIVSEDIYLAFQRHATSKIRTASDLGHVTTLGFRGEALPSIASVSKVTMTTRVAESVLGTRAEVHGGSLVAVTPAGCPAGTTVEVKDLFYNMPARRKTMKGPAAEGAIIGEQVSRMALSRPGVRFELCTHGKRVFYTPGTGRLIDAIASVYGFQMGKEMLAVTAVDGDLSVEGFVGKPSLSRSTRSHLTIIVNGRYVRCPVAVRVLEEAYRTMLPKGRKPVAILSLSVPPEQLDVNVHPAKLEVRLLEDEKIARLVAGALRSVLHERSVIPAAVPDRKYKNIFKSNERPNTSQWPALFSPTMVQTPQVSQLVPSGQVDEPVPQVVYGKAVNSNVSIEQDRLNEKKNDMSKLPVLFPLAQLLPTYILAGSEDGLYIIDQHAAHERVLYEECLSGQGKYPSQCLLVPITLELEYKEATILSEMVLWLTDAGFIIEHFGGNTFLLRGAPAYLPAGSEKELFLDIIDYCKEKGYIPDRTAFLERLAASVACRGAVKAGETMTLSAMEALLHRLARAENPFTCPHGRPTIIHLSRSDLENRFKR
ncbi:MAG: DNA mismatch repair protein MutL [Pelotomaculum sp. PtaB.Bin104]|nr:MAG: DNA mismatch repair protein MutL [Pelotomaculum sp. PtaB.Bin104]